MMFTVSRTPLPETGFEPLPRHKATEITVSYYNQRILWAWFNFFPFLRADE